MSAIVLHRAPDNVDIKPSRMLISGPLVGYELAHSTITGGRTEVVHVHGRWFVMESIDDIANMLNACYIPRDAEK